MPTTLDPKRVIVELNELRALTADLRGAQRVAFTPTWSKAREWLEGKCREAGLECHRDAAGNFWATLAGTSPKALLIGGHIDSVPNGGWLDGCLNLVAGLEVIRRIRAETKGMPPLTLRLVDWADEEGARFGRSLFGSAACCGSLELESVRHLTDKDGIALPDALEAVGVDFDRILESQQELAHAAAYLELHIEQGPVLLERGLSLGAVVGTVGVERHAVTFLGQAAHSGSTPMHSRRDAFLAAGRMAQEIYAIAQRYGGVCTIGSCTTKPGIVTSVVEECRITLDQRHLDKPALAAMLAAAHDSAERIAREGHVGVSWDHLWKIDPIPFSAQLVHLCEEAIEETCAVTHRMPSGPLHDAASVARKGIPTVMLFVQSLKGISHNQLEDTSEGDLELSVIALDRLASRTIGWIASGGHRKVAV
ncbi:MAG: Zn-dependent hydrolase [Phycisphaerales bacterium]|nr:Zn-dependent hydrolase [Phycisphaerales bacterium]